MKLLLTGLSHHTAPVEVRERLAIPEPALADELAALRQRAGADEALIVSTCNRVEVAITSENDSAAGAVREFFTEHNMPGAASGAGSLDGYLYELTDRDAIRHIFRVAASLDSMVLGEPQILGQMKAAYAAARAGGALHGILDDVLTRAFSVAKRIRTETGIGRSAVSVSYAAVELARQIFGDLKGKTVLIAGAGKMSELAARHLHGSGCDRILVTNRTRSRAVEMAELFGGQVIDYEDWKPRLAEMDIVITSSGAADYILRRDELRRALDKRRNRPMFVIDIAVPRNVEPAVNELENVFLYDIDDLGRAVEQNLKARQREAEEAEQIIEGEIERLIGRWKARVVAPTLVKLQQQLDELARAEMERVRGKLSELSPQQEEALAAYTRGLLNKIAHGPLTEIRRAAALPNGEETIALIRRIFRLED
ncbi:MAG: glutamyl-tRNA reductase [Bryobacteraceae bacterium]